jgi:hypothetical protein
LVFLNRLDFEKIDETATLLVRNERRMGAINLIVEG